MLEFLVIRDTISEQEMSITHQAGEKKAVISIAGSFEEVPLHSVGRVIRAWMRGKNAKR